MNTRLGRYPVLRFFLYFLNSTDPILSRLTTHGTAHMRCVALFGTICTI